MPVRLSSHLRFTGWLLVFVLFWHSVAFLALGVTSFRYDEVGHKIAQQDANGRVTLFGYDVRGRMIWRALPMGQVEQMAYDAGGELVKSSDFRGKVTSYTYDDRGRLLVKAPDASLNEATLSYSYPDENTRIAYRGSAATKQSYDPQRGWLNSVTGPNGTLSYGYNPEGQKVSMTSPSGTTRYGYDVLGRLSQISDQKTSDAAPTSIAAYTYDAVGNVASITRGNGVVTSYGYDELNRLTQESNTDAHGTQLSTFAYALRPDGKRTGLQETLVNAPDPTSGLTTSSARQVSYTYDNAGKLLSESGTDGKGVAYANTWSYDGVGNRTGASHTTPSHTTLVQSVFNANDQLTSSSSSVDGGAAVTQTYGYDANGAEQSVASASGSSSNAWSFEGKLTSTAYADSNGQATGGSANSFDAAGDRLARVDKVGTANQKTTSYLVDSDTSYSQVVEEWAPDVSDAQGAAGLQARYVWGQGLAPLAMWRKMSDGSVKLFFHIADGQESVRQLTDASGAVADSYFYDAWGNSLAGSTNNVLNPFRYTGQQLDSDGRYYLRARFYSPGNGRFLSHDPLLGQDENPVSLHRYLYAGADGVNLRDPSGRASLGEVMESIFDSELIDVIKDASIIKARNYIGKKIIGLLQDRAVDAIFSALVDMLSQAITAAESSPTGYADTVDINWSEVEYSAMSVFAPEQLFKNSEGLSKGFQRAAFAALSNALAPYATYLLTAYTDPKRKVLIPTWDATILNALWGAIGAYVADVGSDQSDVIREKVWKCAECKKYGTIFTQRIDAFMLKSCASFFDQMIENFGTQVTQGLGDDVADAFVPSGVS